MPTQTRPAPDDVRYPIGRFESKPAYSSAEVAHDVERILGAPALLSDVVRGLNEAQLDTPYREGGWTVRQVAHHIPDSALNAYVRMKLALTEDHPTIKPYDENRWSGLPDARHAPVGPSLRLFEAVCERWGVLLRKLSPGDLARTFYHPESNADFSVDRQIELYAWHGEHHVAQIRALRRRRGW